MECFAGKDTRLQRMETDPYNPFDQNLIKQLNNKIIDEPVEFPDLITTEINDHHPADFFPGSLLRAFCISFNNVLLPSWLAAIQ